MDNSNLIATIISTLDSVEIHGKDNMSKLLGCINALESILSQENTEAEDGGEINGEPTD